MSLPDDEFVNNTVRQLLARALDGTIQPGQVNQLDVLLAENASARQYYLECIHLHLGLRRLSEKKAASARPCDEDILDERLWEELARNELTAEPAVVAPCQSAAPTYEDTPAAVASIPLSRRVNKSAFYVAIMSTAVLLSVVCYLLVLPPVRPIVGMLSDAMDCHWAQNTHLELKVGQDIRAEAHTLLQGIVKLRFDSGAKVLIEGPAEFFPLSVNSMRLTSGRAFAQVPGAAAGFTIKTPHSRVVDLGTSFGVLVDPAGGSEVHVYEGSVNLLGSQDGMTRQSEILSERQARRMDLDGKAIRSADFQPYLFIQGMDSANNRIWYGPPVCLADVAAGGSGRSARGPSQEGIDPATGLIHATARQEFDRIGTGRYELVSERRLIDGVFVPNGPSVVSSAGHRCEVFPATDGTYWSDITTWPFLSHIALNENGDVLYEQELAVSLSPDTGGAKCDVPRILLHSNAGITFDLTQIRQAHRAQIVRFEAYCGPSHNVLAHMEQEFWVLLDGRVAFRHRFSETVPSGQRINIPIRPEQQFLTLAVTDGGDGTSFDWSIFESPRLELAPYRAE